MEQHKYLIDTNISIYYFGSILSESAIAFLESLFKSKYYLSVINRIELLGFSNLTENEYNALETYVKSATLLDLDEAVILETIRIRREYRVKLPDAIIAATCLMNGCCLVTNNKKDFDKIKGLELRILRTIA
jgi:predicted nucleic acid-binding protein